MCPCRMEVDVRWASSWGHRRAVLSLQGLQPFQGPSIRGAG